MLTRWWHQLLRVWNIASWYISTTSINNQPRLSTMNVNVSNKLNVFTVKNKKLWHADYTYNVGLFANTTITTTTTYDYHYYHNLLWAFSHVLKGLQDSYESLSDLDNLHSYFDLEFPTLFSRFLGIVQKIQTPIRFNVFQVSKIFELSSKIHVFVNLFVLFLFLLGKIDKLTHSFLVN